MVWIALCLLKGVKWVCMWMRTQTANLDNCIHMFVLSDYLLHKSSQATQQNVYSGRVRLCVLVCVHDSHATTYMHQMCIYIDVLRMFFTSDPETRVQNFTDSRTQKASSCQWKTNIQTRTASLKTKRATTNLKSFWKRRSRHLWIMFTIHCFTTQFVTLCHFEKLCGTNNWSRLISSLSGDQSTWESQ